MQKALVEKLRIGLRVVFYQDGDFWIAHCLEMDVVGHAKSKAKAFENLLSAIAMQITASIANNNPANIFMPADAKFFEMFSAGKDIAEAECVVEQIEEVNRTFKPRNEVTIEDVEAREYHRAAFVLA